MRSFFLLIMGNYISTRDNRVNALILISTYMTNKSSFILEDASYRNQAIKTCKEAFKRVYKCSSSPIQTLEFMRKEYETYEDKCGMTSRYIYDVGIEVIDDILQLMS